jgi:orotidine-5'-phosphate decarboxylase
VTGARDRLCLALDTADLDEAVRWVGRTRHAIRTFKVGLELFAAGGPAVVHAVRRAGADAVFLDLKLHDIPNTVAGAVRALRPLSPDYLTVHTGGGRAMLAEAVGAAANTCVLGVTVLTSLDAASLAETGVSTAVADLAAARARLALGVGLGGLVCSPAEATALRVLVGPALRLVTPGIRPAGTAAGDQRRVATPAAALAAGADLLVVGRAVTAAPDPDAALASLLAEAQ